MKYDSFCKFVDNDSLPENVIECRESNNLYENPYDQNKVKQEWHRYHLDS